MPRRKTSLRRRQHAGSSMLPEQIEVLITGDWQHGAIIPRTPETGGRAFRDLAHAREVYEAHRELVLRIHRNGWKPGDCPPTLSLSLSQWVRDEQPCWAEEVFDRGEKYDPYHTFTTPEDDLEDESEPAAPAAASTSASAPASEPRRRRNAAQSDLGNPAPVTAPAESTERRAFSTGRTIYRKRPAPDCE